MRTKNLLPAILPILACIAGIALVLLLKFGLEAIKPEPVKKVTDPFLNPYRVEVIDEHEAHFIGREGDTIKVYLEDAYNLMTEEVVYLSR